MTNQQKNIIGRILRLFVLPTLVLACLLIFGVILESPEIRKAAKTYSITVFSIMSFHALFIAAKFAIEAEKAFSRPMRKYVFRPLNY